MNFKTIRVAFICGITLGATVISGHAYAQKYKTAADTVKLNKEYSDITIDIAKLNEKLTLAQSRTADYQAKAEQANKDTKEAAQASKEQAAAASDGDAKALRKALKKARTANSQASDARDAANNEKDNAKDIKSLNKQIEKKKNRLAELDKMRVAITAQPDPAAMKQ